MVIVWTDLIAGSAEIVMEVFFDVSLDLCLGTAGPGQEDGSRCCLRTLDALGMVMGAFDDKCTTN